MNNLTLCCIPVAKEYISKELTRYKRQKTCEDLVHFFHSTKKKKTTQNKPRTSLANTIIPPTSLPHPTSLGKILNPHIKKTY